MSRKENALDLAKFIDKGVRVKLSGGREGARMFLAIYTVRLQKFCAISMHRDLPVGTF